MVSKFVNQNYNTYNRIFNNLMAIKFWWASQEIVNEFFLEASFFPLAHLSSYFMTGLLDRKTSIIIIAKLYWPFILIIHFLTENRRLWRRFPWVLVRTTPPPQLKLSFRRRNSDCSRGFIFVFWLASVLHNSKTRGRNMLFTVSARFFFTNKNSFLRKRNPFEKGIIALSLTICR